MNTLVIVESPTKAKTITKFLGKGFLIESSFGHIRDLPAKSMGVDIANDTFLPKYVIPTAKKARVKKLQELAAKSTEVIFATDEDREGEAISWHLAQALKLDPEKVKRIVFHEITKTALTEALAHPRHIDQKLVDAQQARRVLDRLVGYELSPFLWKKVARGLSAGRVQSVAVRLIVERERAINNFQTQEYWTLTAHLHHGQDFLAPLWSKAGKKYDKLDLNSREKIDTILADLAGASFVVSQVSKKETKRQPAPPFTTSTLQQAANNRFGYSAKQTMVLAQQLYEGLKIGTEGQVGLITYMRTDSVNLAEKFLTEARDYIQKNFGDKYIPDKPRFFANKSKGAQEAHEAIRPTEASRTPESLASYLSPTQLKLYTLIWQRAMASQMTPASFNRTNINLTAKQYTFRATGQQLLFPGWLQIYAGVIKEEYLPDLKTGDQVECRSLQPEQHFTEPPARYSDATLVKALEEYGIGRPSTYAPTLATIEDRGYVKRNEDKRLYPTDIALVVNDLLVEHFSQIVDFQFTAGVEKDLDEIADGEKNWQTVIATFYHPFHDNLSAKTNLITKAETTSGRELGLDPKTGKKISGRIGRFGPYVQLGEATDEEKPRFASLRPGQTLETITLDQALNLLSLPKILGKNENDEEVIVGIGRFGPYLKVSSSYYQLKNLDPYTITLDQAKEVITQEQARKASQIIKEFPEENILIKNGRYGPYITDGKKNARVPKGRDPQTLALVDCQQLLAQAKEGRRPRRPRRIKNPS
ncbi:MAG TPA: type I DNA topoisomerase [Patescibacteria group bacterium]|nr:type I DNA topoisomerase [Patescibacteria group bacterium]